MKLYLVHGSNEGNTFFKWVGTQADCSAYRAEQTAKGVKRADIKTVEIEVPTDKQGLIAFLNTDQHVQ